MTPIQQSLFALRDEQYALFQAKLTPGIPLQSFIGVRVPLLRKFAKDYCVPSTEENPEYRNFLHSLPHEYYDENMLHALFISQVKDYDECVSLLEDFLPYIDNWAVCDILSPKVFAKHKGQLIEKILVWSSSEHTYTCRFGLGMLMKYFLDNDFKRAYLEIPRKACGEEYYRKMMIAWFFATALAKQWQDTIPYLEQHLLTPWIHNKSIQKAIESYRITPEQKEYLRSLRTKTS